ncbi:hypothetical protein BB561_001817 [Smittium simulii]|uniref:Uncharacterized protein n=1 Tax=Smittium simulii TaxID=133385 RepID=A0A2T9YT16_9FUNG|nr:hypothetical protein BB561_001817 [Smittium simulii]
MYLESETDIPKIRVESKHDVTFVKGEFENLLLKCMENNTTIKDSSITTEAQAALKKILSEELLQWSDKVWDDVGSNMLINGLKYEQVFGYSQKEAGSGKRRNMSDSINHRRFQSCDIEPLDENLQTEVKQLQMQADQLLLNVTKMRKETFVELETDIEKSLEQIEWIVDMGEYTTRSPNEMNHSTKKQVSDTNYQSSSLNDNVKDGEIHFDIDGDKARISEQYYKALQKIENSSALISPSLNELGKLDSNIELLINNASKNNTQESNNIFSDMNSNDYNLLSHFNIEETSKNPNYLKKKSLKSFEAILK